MEGVRYYDIPCHCYRFQGTFDNANGLAVSYTNMKDMVYSLVLKAACKYFGSVKF